MATETAVHVPSSHRVEPGSFPLRTANLPAASPAPGDAHGVAESWVSSFNKVLKSPDLNSVSEVFLSESYWRDQLCLSWDFHCLQGPEKIYSLLNKSKEGARIRSVDLDRSTGLHSPSIRTLGEAHVVRSFLTIETDVGNGKGIVHLANENGKWKAFILFTFLEELRGHEEVTGKRRPNGVEHGEHNSRKNWRDRRNEEEEFDGDEEPTVLIIGAGQSGLTAAARLKMLGINALIIDRHKRVGDSWRSRYHQLVLHDPVWFDHLPYLPFPESWPVFTPKDKLGDWFESYVKLLELNAWTETNVVKSSWDDGTGKWTITLDRTKDGKIHTRVVHPKHIIQATGHSGEASFPSHIKGLSSFKGSRLVHSSQFSGAVPSHGQNKKAIVVGCCNSGHDIAQDFYENGYSVTIIQRSSTFVIAAETNLGALSSLYSEGNLPTPEADALYHCLSNPVDKRLNIGSTKAQNKTDEKLLQGLQKAGFKIDKGPDDSGLWIKYLQRGGGYYIDVGCSQLIIDGKIKIKQGQEIEEVLPTGLKFQDGEILESDEIVFATGYLNMRTQCRKIFGDEVADRVKDVWGFDEEGELRTMWRRSGHPGFWFMGGNLALCRWYSKLLALQIKGLEEGIYKYADL